MALGLSGSNGGIGKVIRKFAKDELNKLLNEDGNEMVKQSWQN